MTKKYYINVTSWNLLESFVTESISPCSFYKKRTFGNNLSRYIDYEKERNNVLILSTTDLGDEYSIILDEELIDLNSLQRIKGCKNIYTYNQTIYYQKELISFRFSSKELCDELIAESKILYEVKCIEKYSNHFIIKENYKKVNSIDKVSEQLAFDECKFIEKDNTYNTYKGALISFGRGLLTTICSDVLNLKKNIYDLKNIFAGLNTQIMMNNVDVDNIDYYSSSIEECKYIYNKSIPLSTNSFDVIKQIFLEIVKTTKLRATEINNSILDEERVKKLKEERSEYQELLYNIKNSSSIEIDLIYKELNIIKNQEKNNGLAIGKERLYFKHGTLEYTRKQELQDEIKHFKENNIKYKLYSLKIKEIDDTLNNSFRENTKYDNNLMCMFTRISDILNELIKKVNSLDTNNTLRIEDLPEINKDGLLFKSNNENSELEYYYSTLNYLLNHQINNITENEILSIIEESARIFKDKNIAKSDSGQIIIETLRNFWLYKNGKRISFSIPENFPILQSIMSFYIKPYGFEQIERYMLNKGYQEKCYALSLWGACIGFYSLPKTFINSLYENEEISILMDKYLESVRNIIKNQI